MVRFRASRLFVSSLPLWLGVLCRMVGSIIPLSCAKEVELVALDYDRGIRCSWEHREVLN